MIHGTHFLCLLGRTVKKKFRFEKGKDSMGSVELINGSLGFQVSPTVSMANDDATVPPWLSPMLRANYFATCPFHRESSKSECNLFCLDCSGDAFCSYCSIHHKDHRIVQVSFHHLSFSLSGISIDNNVFLVVAD